MNMDRAYIEPLCLLLYFCAVLRSKYYYSSDGTPSCKFFGINNSRDNPRDLPNICPPEYKLL